MLRKYCVETEKQWDEGVPFVLFAACDAVQESIGFSSAQLVFSDLRPLKSLHEQFLSCESAPKKHALDYVTLFRVRLQRVNALAKATLKAAVYSPFPSCQDFGLVMLYRAPLFFFQRRATKRKQEHGRVRRHILMCLIAKASFFICSILLCGVGLYFFINKPWFYVSAVYCCCGQRRVELRG